MEPPALPPGLLPEHKSAMVMFLERVYGIEDQMTFFRILENGFLPDLRASTTLDSVSVTKYTLAYNHSVIIILLMILLPN